MPIARLLQGGLVGVQGGDDRGAFRGVETAHDAFPGRGAAGEPFADRRGVGGGDGDDAAAAVGGIGIALQDARS